MLFYGFLLLFVAKETLNKTVSKARGLAQITSGGFRRVLQDRGDVAFTAFIAIGLITPAMLWSLLAVYSNQNYGLSEELFGWIPTTNAWMCVLIQLPVTQITKRFNPLPVVALGMMVYALGVGSVALMTGFVGFWLSIVLMTIGELILVPTASKFVADRSPVDLRGRYMSIYWLTQGISRTIAPLYGGWLNDNISPKAIWVGGLGIGLSNSAGLYALSRRMPEPSAEAATTD